MSSSPRALQLAFSPPFHLALCMPAETLSMADTLSKNVVLTTGMNPHSLFSRFGYSGISCCGALRLAARRRRALTQPQKIPMLGLLRGLGGRWRRWLSTILHKRYGSNFDNPASGNHGCGAGGVRKKVIRALGSGFAEGDNLVAVAQFYQIFMHAATEANQTNQERERQADFDFAGVHDHGSCKPRG